MHRLVKDNVEIDSSKPDKYNLEVDSSKKYLRIM